MKFNRNQAKTLSSDKELELFDSARAPELNKLTVKELKVMVSRSRTLRDKLRDVKRTQVRANQNKAAVRGVLPADRSKEKAELYSEVHDAFVERLAALEAKISMEKMKETDKKLLASAAKRNANKNVDTDAARSLKATSASKAAIDPSVNTIQNPQTAARTELPLGKVEQTRLARSGMTQKRGHMAATNKRNQARRDSK